MDIDMRFDGAGLEDVWRLFDSFGRRHLVGMANDQKPHYHLYLQRQGS